MSKRTILVVEDDPNDEALTLRALRQAQATHQVVVVHTSDDCLDYLSGGGKFADGEVDFPAVVFLDNTLPGVKGEELVRRVRELPQGRTLPLVVLSGTSDLNVVERCLIAGANSFLQKPIELAEYVSHVSAAAHYWLELNLGAAAPQLA